MSSARVREQSAKNQRTEFVRPFTRLGTETGTNGLSLWQDAVAAYLIAGTQPKLHPALLRLSAMISQYRFTHSIVLVSTAENLLDL